ncbi:MAG TPA: M15 family metallopeptidase [Bryobacteraceae bacterium]|jgi:hypothetical protein
MAKNDTKKDEGAPEADAPETPPAENTPNPAPEADAPKAIVPVVVRPLRDSLVRNSWPTRDEAINVFRNPVGIDGNLDPWWESNFLKFVEPPFRMVTSWQEINPNTGKMENKLLRRFRVHERVKPSIDRILAALWQEYGRDQEKIEADDLHLFGGGFEFRKQRNSSRLSLHAYGAAIDWDPDNNPQGSKWNPEKGVPQILIDLFKAEGWTWGGDFKGASVDPMHMEACIE